jgi:hypothetical protein
MSFAIGLLLVMFITLFVALVPLVELTLFLVIVIIPILKRAISNEITMLTTLVSYSLGY